MFPREKSITDIFIDLDGPILDVSERYYRVYKEIITGFGAGALNKKDYWRFKREKAPLEALLESSGAGQSKIPAFKARWLKLIEKKSFLELDRIWPYAGSSLEYLRDRHNLILVTLRNSSVNLRWQLRKLRLYDYFSLILAQDNNGGDWRVKCELIKRAKASYANSFLIGDTEVDILAGRKLGIKTIATLSGIRGRNVLAGYRPDYLTVTLKGALKIIN